MKPFDHHISFRKVVPIGLALLSLFGATSVSAADASQPGDSNSSCRQEMRRIAIWPQSSPKAPTFARFDYREVTVCDGKAVARGKLDPVQGRS